MERQFRSYKDSATISLSLESFLKVPYPRVSGSKCFSLVHRVSMSWPQRSFPASHPTASLHMLCCWPHGIGHFPPEYPELILLKALAHHVPWAYFLPLICGILLGVQAQFRSHLQGSSRPWEQHGMHLLWFELFSFCVVYWSMSLV